MATGAVGQVFQATFVGLMCNQRIMNTFNYVVENIPSGGITTDQICDELNTFLEAPDGIQETFLGCCPTNYTLQEQWIQCIGPTARYVKKKYAQGASGDFGFTADTANVAAVITRTTEKSGRSQVSSLHIPIGASADWLTEGILEGTLTTAMELLCDQIPLQLGVFGSLTMDPVIYHGPVPALPPDDIIAAVAQQTARVMGRRTVGRGI